MCKHMDKITSLIVSIAKEDDDDKISCLRAEMHSEIIDALISKADRLASTMADNSHLLTNLYVAKEIK